MLASLSTTSVSKLPTSSLPMLKYITTPISLISISTRLFSAQSPAMSSTHIVLTDESKFESQLKESFRDAKANDQQLYLYITGAVNPETGKSWCPDCTATQPNLDKLKSAPNSYVLEMPVERAKYRGVPSTECDDQGGCKIDKHPYKTNPKLMVTAIPTLYKVDMVDEAAIPTRLVESDCYDDAKFTAFTGVSV